MREDMMVDGKQENPDTRCYVITCYWTDGSGEPVTMPFTINHEERAKIKALLEEIGGGLGKAVQITKLREIKDEDS